MGKPPSGATSATIQHFSHAHPLNLTYIGSVAALAPPPSCSCCKKRVDSWAYTCEYCKFFLHTECSNLPQLVNHQFHTIHNLTLLVNDKDTYECAACGETGEGFSFHCRPCSLNLHTACSVMPTDLFSRSHHHHLFLAFRSPYPTETFSCDVCHSIGSKWLYRCSICEFDAHLKCAKEAPTTQSRAYGESPPVHANPAMISPTSVATVHAPTMAYNIGGNGVPVFAPVRPNFTGGYGQVMPNMAPPNSGYAVGYATNSHVRPVANHGSVMYQAGNPAPINGSVNYPVGSSPSFNAQPSYTQSTAFPAQYAVPQQLNGNQGVNQQTNRDSFTNQLLMSVVSGAAEGLVGSLLNGGSNNGGGGTGVFIDGGGAAEGVVVSMPNGGIDGGVDSGMFINGNGADTPIPVNEGGVYTV